MIRRRSEPLTVVVIDNHEAIQWGVSAALVNGQGSGPVNGADDGHGAAPADLVVLGRYFDVESFLASGLQPTVVVLDIYLGRDDVVSTPWIAQLAARSAVVLYTAEEKPVPLRQAVAEGASGLALKNDGLESLRAAVLDVADGEFACSSVLAGALLEDPQRAAALTPRELEVLQALDDGLTRRQTARKLGIEEETVKTHLKSVRDKYLGAGRDITNSTSIVREAMRDGWLA